MPEIRANQDVVTQITVAEAEEGKQNELLALMTERSPEEPQVQRIQHPLLGHAALAGNSHSPAHQVELGHGMSIGVDPTSKVVAGFGDERAQRRGTTYRP